MSNPGPIAIGVSAKARCSPSRSQLRARHIPRLGAQVFSLRACWSMLNKDALWHLASLVNIELAARGPGGIVSISKFSSRWVRIL